MVEVQPKEKMNIRKNSFTIGDKEYSIFFHRSKYNLKLISSSLIADFNIEPSPYQSNIYQVPGEEFDKIPWIVSYGKVQSRVFFYEKLDFPYLLDQNNSIYLLEGNNLFPIFRFLNTGHIEQYGHYPSLHTSLNCSSVPSRGLRVRYSNTILQDIADASSRKVYSKSELNFCKVCEPDQFRRSLSKLKVFYNISEVLENI